MVLTNEHPRVEAASFSEYLSDERVFDGAAGVRYALTLWKKASPRALELQSYCGRLFQINVVNRPHIFRLLELMCSLGIASDPRLIHIPIVEQSLEHGTVTMAALHCLKAWCNNTFYPKGNLDKMASMLAHIVISDADTEKRCLALSTLAAVVKFSLARHESLARLCLDIVLWKLPWQHQLFKKTTKSWGVPHIIPHDDAYTILTHYSDRSLVELLRPEFTLARSDQTILEPLMALIVDRFAEPDSDWPKMFSVVVRGGLIDYFQSIAMLASPEEMHPKFSEIHSARRDALTGIVRCFENLRAEDAQRVGTDVVRGLKDLAADPKQPVGIKWQAEAALEAWGRIGDTTTHDR